VINIYISRTGSDHGYFLADLPDEYFSPTAADLKAAQQTLSARTQALVNAPLQLRAVREANEKAKLDRWPNVSCACQSMFN
jgi:tether containing UBX domain for GLUT4